MKCPESAGPFEDTVESLFCCASLHKSEGLFLLASKVRKQSSHRATVRRGFMDRFCTADHTLFEELVKKKMQKIAVWKTV